MVENSTGSPLRISMGQECTWHPTYSLPTQRHNLQGSGRRASAAHLWRPLNAANQKAFMYVHQPRPSCFITQRASRRSSNKEAWRRSSAVVASLSLPSPGEDSASRPSTDLGSKIDLKLPRRRLQLSFTCDACGARSERLINPDAYASGTVFVQCAGCEVYHKLVDNLGLIEEYDFRQETNNKADEVDLNVAE